MQDERAAREAAEARVSQLEAQLAEAKEAAARESAAEVEEMASALNCVRLQVHYTHPAALLPVFLVHASRSAFGGVP
jgi:hypothetical protein